MSSVPVDMVNHPPHYKFSKYETIDLIDEYRLTMYHGNAIKYLGRAGHKKDKIEDLRKAVWYLTHWLELPDGERLYNQPLYDNVRINRDDFCAERKLDRELSAAIGMVLYGSELSVRAAINLLDRYIDTATKST